MRERTISTAPQRRGWEAGSITPGKTYEYLASGTPIVAAVPESDAKDILVAAGCRTIAEPDDVDAIAANIRALVADWRRRVEPPPPRPEVVSVYERRHLTERLAGFFDELIAGGAGTVIGD